MAAVTIEELRNREAELTRKIASGELQVNYQTHSVRFRDMKEMKEALAFVRTEISRLEGTPPRRQQIRMVTRDGYGSSSAS